MLKQQKIEQIKNKLKNKSKQMLFFLDQRALIQLKNYHYKPGTYSWLDNKINPFWQMCVQLMPNMAPNLITFIGFIFVVLSYAVMLFYDFTFRQDIPRWTFLFAAICIFIYQTLDAIDGKQARRTKSSSPLGQLFDHGCDSFSITFFILAICQAVKMQYDQVFYLFCIVQSVAFVSNWKEQHTGVLTTQMFNFGVTQTQLLCSLMHILTYMFGQQFWQFKFYSIIPGYLMPMVESNQFRKQNITIKSFLEIRVYQYVLSWVTFLMIIIMISSFITTVYAQKQRRAYMVKEWIPLVILIAIQIFFYLKIQIFKQYVGIILVSFGILFSLIICKLITCSMTKMKFSPSHFQIYYLLIGTLIIYISQQYSMQDDLTRQYSKNFFWAYFVINIITIIKFLSFTIQQITSFLKIRCFKIANKT